MNRLITTLNLLLAIVLVLALGTVNSQQASAANSSINACANKTTGQLRLAPPKCKATEKPISWNMQGPAGTDASVKTETVVLSYLGLDTGCGTIGGNSISQAGKFNVFGNWSINSSNLESAWMWKEVPRCVAYFDVVK